MPRDSSSSKVKFPPWKFYELREIVFIVIRLSGSLSAVYGGFESVLEGAMTSLALVDNIN